MCVCVCACVSVRYMPVSIGNMLDQINCVDLTVYKHKFKFRHSSLHL